MILQLRAWHARYGKAGLAVVGVHSPEFFWEKPRQAVADATRRLGVPYPVVQDNDFAIWKRFGVRAWPTRFVVDREGVAAPSTSARAPTPRPTRCSAACSPRWAERDVGRSSSGAGRWGGPAATRRPARG